MTKPSQLAIDPAFSGSSAIRVPTESDNRWRDRLFRVRVKSHKRVALTALLLSVFAATFVVGIFTGRWAVKAQLSDQLREKLAARDGWSPLNTQLVQLETSIVQIPEAAGWGGGIKPLPDGQLLFATGHGAFGIIGLDRKVTTFPFAIDMNLPRLMQHPVAEARNFNKNWVRVTDVNLSALQDKRFDLLIGHHFFNEERQCIELRLSRATLDLSGTDARLVDEFRKVTSTEPCITFAGPNAGTDAFSGWSSGGRILRMNGQEVLFSTGDHNWAGVRGYPSLSQDESSSLGKILRVELTTGRSRMFAKGVRNPQGLARDSKGRIWETEHGPRGGDELNLLEEGQDYGWPNSTYGTDYGPRPWPLSATQGRHQRGRLPVFAWSPSIGVSNLIEVRGREFSEWRGDLLVLSLASQTLHRLRVEDDRVIYDEPINFAGHRLRDIAELSDGQLALLTDEGGVILLRNASKHGRGVFLDASRQLRRTTEMTAAERETVVAGGYVTGTQLHAGATRPSGLTAPVVRGQEVFEARCARCHSSVDDGAAVAPNLTAIVGRRIGSTSFAYSDALMGRQASWTVDAIVEFAVAPAVHFPGVAMAPVTLNSAEESDLKAYLSKL